MSSRGVWAILRFEGKKSLRLSRVLWWAILALVPFFLALSIRSGAPSALRREGEVAAYLYILAVRALPSLALLLWAAPAIHAEAESRAWTYVASSPRGKSSLVAGKYLLAVLWSAAVGTLAVSACLFGAFPEHAGRLWPVFAELVALSSAAYGGLYLLVGAIALRRAMVAAVAYTFAIEVAVTLVPAVVNQLTIDYRLRSILAGELGLAASISRASPDFLATGPAWEQAAILGLYALGAVAASLAVVSRRQLVAAGE